MRAAVALIVMLQQPLSTTANKPKTGTASEEKEENDLVLLLRLVIVEMGSAFSQGCAYHSGPWRKVHKPLERSGEPPPIEKFSSTSPWYSRSCSYSR